MEELGSGVQWFKNATLGMRLIESAVPHAKHIPCIATDCNRV
jgi:hypothetical protein